MFGSRGMFFGKCQRRITPTRNSVGECFETRPLLECLLGICFAFQISTQAGIKPALVCNWECNVTEKTAFVFSS